MSDQRRSTHEAPGIPHASDEAERSFSEHGLTEREVDAARSVLAGMTAEMAAREMGIEASTVGGFRQRAYHKLGMEDGRELVRRYGPHGDKDANELANDIEGFRSSLVNRGLTDTQLDVLARAAAGVPTSEIARELHVAPGTVGCARSNGYRLLGVRSREELLSMLEGERTERERRQRRGKRLALGCMVTVIAVSALLALAGAFLPVDSIGEFLSGEAVGMRSVNGVLYAINENDQTFGSIERANLPEPWDEFLEHPSVTESDMRECLPDLIATTSTSSNSYGQPGYVRKEDFLSGTRSPDGYVIVWEANGRREMGSIQIGRFTPR
ncbi:helix-turn-helix transcriptional regulator [Thermophilibacter sp. ZX-H3]|uniref:helix-turn-helix transcriptional regulator n=1 Tax=unclassified Thermophilibacter TaxID=2847308 RepID=UPI004040723C